MSTATAPPAIPTEGRVSLSAVPWAAYERILEELGDRRIRLTYDRGELEIMSPSEPHERFKKLIGRLIERLSEELEIPIRSSGSTTFRSELEQRGLEPDECYYVASEPRVRGKKAVDLAVDPPPDLAVEVEVSRSALDRMVIYASLGIREVWRFDGRHLHIEVLAPDRTWKVVDRSPSFPVLSSTVIDGFLARADETDETTWIRSFRDLIRSELDATDSRDPG